MKIKNFILSLVLLTFALGCGGFQTSSYFLSDGIYYESPNLVKKLVGLSIFQTSAYLIFVAPGKIFGGTVPVLDNDFITYSSPLPHVLILTAIVVGVATLSLGLALAVRINESFGTIAEDKISDVNE